MPTYHYKCFDCNEVEARFHWMSEKPEIICPKCGKRMERGIAGCSIIIPLDLDIDKCINDGW
jgi:putative FmdB family regulatory protein